MTGSAVLHFRFAGGVSSLMQPWMPWRLLQNHSHSRRWRSCRACHCLAARKRARAITRLYEEKLRPHGLRATQYSILAALALKGSTPVGELADLLGLERTSSTRSAQVVERNGWITSEESGDARERPLRITDGGLEKLLAAFPDWKEAQEMIDRGWPDGEGRPE